MKTTTSTTVFFDFVTGATARRRLYLRFVVFLVGAGIMLAGCGPAMKRADVTRENLIKLRSTSDDRSAAAGEKLLGRLLQRTKAEYDRRVASGQKGAPVIDILIISGGGDWGAFGAGFLKGWLESTGAAPVGQA